MKNLLKRLSYYAISCFTLFSQTNTLFILPIIPFSKKIILKLHDNTQFCIRSIMDIWVIKESYLDKDYEKFGFKIPKKGVLIDVGAFIGDYSILASKQSPNLTIFAIEPSKDNYELLLKNIKLNNSQNILPFYLALHSSLKEINIHTNNTDPSQFYTINKKDSIHETTKALSLEKFFVQNNIQLCNLLKLDCEGAEYDILLNTSKKFLNNHIEKIVMEFHHNDQYDVKSLSSYLTDSGYKVSVYPPKFQNGTGFLKGNRTLLLN